MKWRIAALSGIALTGVSIAGCGVAGRPAASTPRDGSTGGGSESRGGSDGSSGGRGADASATGARGAARLEGKLYRGSLAKLEGDEDDDDTTAGLLKTNKYDDDAGDFDNDEKPRPRGFFDADDEPSGYGREVPAKQAREAAGLAERYYELASRGAGAGACELLTPDLRRVLPRDFGRFGPSYLRGSKTCGAVLSGLFAHDHASTARQAKEMLVVQVRAKGSDGVVLFGGREVPANELSVRRLHGRWTVGAIIGRPLS